jgi:hypothetical protein
MAIPGFMIFGLVSVLFRWWREFIEYRRQTIDKPTGPDAP